MTDPILSVPPGGALSVRDFCRWSSLGRTAVYEEIGRGRLKARKVGRRTIILFEDARRWLDTLPTHEEALDAADNRACINGAKVAELVHCDTDTRGRTKSYQNPLRAR